MNFERALIERLRRHWVQRRTLKVSGPRPPFRALRRVATHLLAVSLSCALVLTPLSPLMMVKPLAPVTAAQASAADDLVSCLNIGNAAIGAATDIAKAVADETYVACVAEAAAGNLVTIGMMAAVTALWATNTSAFSKPDECELYIKGKLLGFIAEQIAKLIGDGSNFVGDILKGMIGEDGVQMIKDLAKYAGVDVDKEVADAKDEAAKKAAEETKKIVDDLIATLSEALGPLTHYLDCGCAAAGTAAIVKNAAEKVGDSADACLDALKDPAAVFKAILDDPLGVGKAIIGAACDAVKEAVDVCGFAKDVYETAKAICDIPGVDYACGGVSGAVTAVYCIFADCDDGTVGPPPKFEQYPCQIGWNATTTWYTPICSCPAPYGLTSEKGYAYSDFYKSMEEYDGWRCDTCPPGSGRDKEGFCQACPIGLEKGDPSDPGYDGTCKKVYTCGPGELYKPNNTGCFSCPAGSHFNPDKDGCWPDCQAGLINNDRYGGSCTCPDSADGKSQYVTAQGCQVPTECKSWQDLDQATNSCTNFCPDPRQIMVKGTGDASPRECVWCESGQVATNNVCDYPPSGVPVVSCSGDNISINGACEPCPYGTEKTGPTACTAVCPPGSEPKPQPAASGGGAAGKMTDVKAGSLAGFISTKGVSASDAAPNPAQKAQLPAQQKAGGKSPPKQPLPSVCVACAENERTVKMMASGNGYYIETTYCAPCPEGQVSTAGIGKCYDPKRFKEITQSRSRVGEPLRVPDKPVGTKAVPDASKLKTNPVGAKTTCPPGQIMEGGVCRVPRTKGSPQEPKQLPPQTSKSQPQAPQLNMPSFGGGSTAPGVNVGPGIGTTAPATRPGGFTTTPVTPQGGNSKPF